MQNKGAIVLFTILLALASLYQLSFSYFTSSIEKEAEMNAQDQLDSVLVVNPEIRLSERDSIFAYYENKFLRDHANEKVYPGLGFTYQECKEKGINLGLDLEGGMSVVLEVSIPELVQNLSETRKMRLSKMPCKLQETCRWRVKMISLPSLKVLGKN